jgi:hypothetical protein
MRFLVIFLTSVLLYGADISLWQVLDMEAQKTYGTKYASQKSEILSLPEFSLFIDELEGGKEIKTKNKNTPFKSIRVPNDKKLFEYLKKMSASSSSTLPDYYAFLLSRISMLDKNGDFDAKYGTYFASKLIKHDMCEGYYWNGLILSHSPQKWKKSLEAFQKASSLCKGKYAHKAKLDAARLKYLISQKNKKGQK